jgi:hypothetical protein
VYSINNLQYLSLLLYSPSVTYTNDPRIIRLAVFNTNKLFAVDNFAIGIWNLLIVSIPTSFNRNKVLGYQDFNKEKKLKFIFHLY